MHSDAWTHFHTVGCSKDNRWLGVIGTSQRMLPLEQRERFAASTAELPGVYASLKGLESVGEAVILSTCNRFEIYYTGRDECDPTEDILDWLCSFSRLSREQVDASFYQHTGTETARHLFRVTAGLDSALLGETDITGQIKQAYLEAQHRGMTACFLNRLFQKALHSTKLLRSRTSIASGPVSLGAVVVKFVKSFFGKELKDSKLLLWGAGHAADSTARHLIRHGVDELWIVNRTQAKAQDLAGLCQSGWLSWEQAMSHLPAVDVVVVCTQAPHYVIDENDIEKAAAQRNGRPLCIIDLAVPRNVDPAVGSHEGVALYNIDDLWSESARSLDIRNQQVGDCNLLIDEQVQHFSRWLGRAVVFQ